MKKILVLGAGGTGRDVVQILGDINAVRPTYECVGFLDDDPAKQGATLEGVPVHGPLADAPQWGDAWFVNALGSVSTHWRMDAWIASLGIPEKRFETIVHPTAAVSPRAVLGPGCLIYPHVSIISDVVLGRQVVILPNSVLNRAVIVGDFAILASGVLISSAVAVGTCAYLGAGCNIIQKAVIGERSLVGLGAVVVRDVASGTVVVGNPAEYLRPSVPGGAQP